MSNSNDSKVYLYIVKLPYTEIKKVEVIRFTDKSYWRESMSGKVRVFRRISDWQFTFETYEEAKQFIITRLRLELEKYEEILRVYPQKIQEKLDLIESWENRSESTLLIK
jgi:hypothetical protein